MAVYKGRVVGYGAATYQHVLMIDFTQPLSSKVTYECYDNETTIPLTDPTNTGVGNHCFGIYATSDSMISLHDLTAAPAAATNWVPTAVRSNTGSVNLMEGIVSYVTQQGATLQSAGGGSIFYNMRIKIPEASQTSHLMQFDVLARYTYTSTIPTVQFWFNSMDAGGTAPTPVWATIGVDNCALRHCRTATASTGPWLANIPETGSEKTEEGWVTVGAD